MPRAELDTALVLDLLGAFRVQLAYDDLRPSLHPARTLSVPFCPVGQSGGAAGSSCSDVSASLGWWGW
jgi:hypothetical protein